MEDKTMRHYTPNLLPALALLLFIGACSIKAPVVKVTGEKTALEQEVIGTYHQMEEDTWMIASTRAAAGEDEVKISPEKKKVLEALQQQKFNKDDIEEFKRKGYVGENNQGFLEIRPSKELENDSETHKLVHDIIEEENLDREIIMDRVVELNASLKTTMKEDVLGVFAKMNQDNSPKGTWVQTVSGSWMKK
jgi:uncharacterized protein YdbL (DUF1318 family)